MEKDNAKLLDVFFHASQNVSNAETGNICSNFIKYRRLIVFWYCTLIDIDKFEHTPKLFAASEDNHNNSNGKQSQFPMFTILVGFLHFDGNVGQQAR